MEKTLQFPAVSGAPKTACSSGFRAEGCQRAQRLWKVFHRDDAEPVRVPSCLPRVVPGRHKEGVHTRPASAERLLLHAADREHLAVEGELSRRRDLVSVGDVAAGSWRMSSAKASPAEGPPTSPVSILTGNGSFTSRSSRAVTPMIALAGSLGSAAVVISRLADLPVSSVPDGHLVAGMLLLEQPAQLENRLHGLAVDRDDHVARLDHLRRRCATLDDQHGHARLSALTL